MSEFWRELAKRWSWRNSDILPLMYREQEFNFVYEDGVLRPEGRLDLPDGARGIAHIREAALPGGNASRRRAIEAIRRIGEAGVFNSGGRKLTRDQMHARG